MSVWANARYSDDAWQVLARNLHPNAACNSDGLKLLDHHTDGCSRTGYNVEVGTIKQAILNGQLKYTDIKTPGRVRHSISLQKYLAEYSHAKFYYGLEAVYKLINIFWYQWEQSFDLSQHHNEYFRQNMLFDGAASQLTNADINDRTINGLDVARYTINRAHVIEIILKKLAGFMHRKNVKAALHGDDKLYTAVRKIGKKTFRISIIPGMLIFRQGAYDKHYFITNRDIDCIKTILSGIATYQFTAALHSKPLSGINHEAYRKSKLISELMVERMGALSKQDCNFLVRAFDVAYHMHMASLTVADSDTAFQMQQEKWRSEKLDRIFDISSYLNIVQDCDIITSKELLNLHRCLPTPDFDFISHLDKQMSLYEENLPAPEFDINVETEIIDIMKWYMVIAFKKKNGIYPGAPTEDFRNNKEYEHWPVKYLGKFTPDVINQLDLEGTFDYNARTMDYLDLLKDKAVCPEDFTEQNSVSDFYRYTKLQRSQILEMLGKSELEDMSNMRDDMQRHNYTIKLDDKAEAKKPGGRMFMIATSKPRLVCSEYEDNVAHYIEEIEQITIGKSRGDKIKSLNDLGAPPTIGSPTLPLFVSFDLAKWSPRITARLHKRIDAMFAYLFGQPHLNEVHRVVSEGYMVYIKRNMMFTMEKMGRDFEGLAGKRLTLYHLAVMHHAVFNLMEQDLCDHGAKFQVFIDDGLLRVVSKKQWTRERIKLVEQSLDRSYRQAGLMISWDKTYISQAWSVYLNDEMYYSTKVGNSVRALMKLDDRCDVLAPTILDKIAHLDGRVSGSLMAGSFLYPTMMLKHFKYMHLMENELGTKMAANYTLWNWVPVSHGGIGLRSVLSQGSSLSGKPIIDAIGYLKCISRRFPNTAPIINEILNVEMNIMSEEAALKTPWTIRRKLPTLVHSKVINFVENAIRKQRVLPGLSMLLSDIEGVRTVDDGNFLLIGHSVSLVANQLIYKTSRDAVYGMIAAKILRGTSAMALVGSRNIIRCVYSSSNNFERVIATW